MAKAFCDFLEDVHTHRHTKFTLLINLQQKKLMGWLKEKTMFSLNVTHWVLVVLGVLSVGFVISGL